LYRTARLARTEAHRIRMASFRGFPPDRPMIALATHPPGSCRP